MTTLGLYFPLSSPAANALRARINTLAQALGYSTAATLLQAVDRGDVALIMLDPEEIPRAIAVLDGMPFEEDWPQSIVRALRQAIERGREADASDPEGYRAYLEAKKRASPQVGDFIGVEWEDSQGNRHVDQGEVVDFDPATGYAEVAGADGVLWHGKPIPD